MRVIRRNTWIPDWQEGDVISPVCQGPPCPGEGLRVRDGTGVMADEVQLSEEFPGPSLTSVPSKFQTHTHTHTHPDMRSLSALNNG
ncbi:unnamed protein product [Leuciscus chuanchicus]